MGFSRRSFRVVCLWLVLALLGMQQAIAGYVCPVQAGMAAMADMADCDGDMGLALDPDQPSLCKAHCEQGSRVVNQTPVNLVGLFAPVLLVVLDWAPILLAAAQVSGLPAQVHAGAPPPGSPPLYLSLQVLRN